MWYSVLVGLILAAATIAIHASGTTSLIGVLKRKYEQNPDAIRHGHPLRTLCMVVTVLLMLHICEVTVWATVYIFLLRDDPFETLEEAVYFSTVTFTSLGYGDLVIEGSWRLLGAIQSMVGLLVFGWSSALLFALVQRMFDPTDQPE